jgi:uncharacterized membrane protein YheB (UPF0754 family)
MATSFFFTAGGFMNFHINPWIYTIPFISAIIHWVTIWMALKMLFHPKQPKRFLGMTFQGVFPKKQYQIAENLGRIVGQELLSFQDIEQKITGSGNLDGIYPEIEKHIDEFLRVKLKDAMPMIAMFVGEATIGQMKTVFMDELKGMLPGLLKNYIHNLKGELDLERIVVEKIKGFSSDRLENMLNQILTKEFRFVEVIGAALGFIIGVVQILITMATT